MPGYLVDENGERTHAVLQLDEYERLVDASERLSQVRGFASQMMAVVEDEEQTETPASEESTVSEGETPAEGTEEGANESSEEAQEPQERQGWLGR